MMISTQFRHKYDVLLSSFAFSSPHLLLFKQYLHENKVLGSSDFICFCSLFSHLKL